MSKKVILNARIISERLRPLAEAEPRINALWLFGSHINGIVTPQSDVDLAILPFEHLDFWDRMAISDEYAAALNLNRVDFLDIHQTSILLRVNILRGLLIYERNSLLVNKFLLETTKEARHNAYRREQSTKSYLQSLREEYRV